MISKAKPDRIARIVDRVIDQAEEALLHRNVVLLLRREAAYQRARVRKIIATHRERIGFSNSLFERGQIRACHDLLARLKEGR